MAYHPYNKGVRRRNKPYIVPPKPVQGTDRPY